MAKPLTATNRHELIWEDPPAKYSQRARSIFTVEVEEALRARPGEWARIAVTKSGATASSLNQRYADFEFCMRRMPDGKGHGIYARCIGTDMTPSK